jgi:PPM family protein phosphatase
LGSNLHRRTRGAAYSRAKQKGQGAVPMRPGIELAGLSDVGCRRDDNQDYYSYWEPDAEPEFRRKGRLLLVADGMGGYEGGREASRIAGTVVPEVYCGHPAEDVSTSLVVAFQAAHQRIRSRAAQSPALQGMGTTCTAAVLLGGALHIAHIGDSRLYLVRDGAISRLTHDHSYVGRLVEQGVLSSQEAETHPQRNILTAALGAGSEIFPETSLQPIALERRDTLTLCTDGLWSVVSDQEICEAAGGEDLNDVCRELVNLARERGAPDNVTVQTVRMMG